MAEVASAYVSLLPSARGFTSGVVKETDSAARTAGKRFGGIFSGSVKSIIGGALAGAGVTKFLSDSLGEAREAQKATALTNQVIKSTGGVANVTAKHVGDLATAISNKIGVDDEAIQSGENLLLTFKNVRNEAGKGNDIFDQATHSLVNLAAGMAAASGGELNFRTSTTLVGKALNDPVKGLTALARVGVTFTKGQQDQIKALVKSGDRMKAQKIILRELKSEFGGAAKSQSTDADRARVAIGNLEEQIGTALLPVVDDLARKVTKDVVPAVSKFITQMQDGTGAGGDFVDVLQDTVGVGKDILSFFNGLPGPVKKYGIELLIAGVALNKVNNGLVAGRSAVSGWVSSLGPAEGTLTRTQKASYALGVGLRNLAGAGGMLAIVDGAKRSNKAVGILETTLGGAAAGFAAGGPFGAAVGGTVGLFGSLVRAMKETTSETNKHLHPATESYIDTLRVGSDVLTGYTKKLAIKNATESGAIEAGRKLGIASQTVVKAILGNSKAQATIAAKTAAADRALGDAATYTYDKYGNLVSVTDTATQAQKDNAKAAFTLGSALANNVNTLKADIIKKNEAALAAGKYSKVLAGVPKNVATRIDQLGLAKADASITRLTAKYHLTPTQVKTILEAAGERPTTKSIQNVINKANEWARMHPTAVIDANTKPARDKVSVLVSDIRNLLSGNFTALVDVHTTGGGHARARGGPVIAGQPYIVGERRPELFVPGQSGTIIPRVPTATNGTSVVDQEQTAYRAFSRALANTGVVVMSRRNLDELDLLVGAG